MRHWMLVSIYSDIRIARFHRACLMWDRPSHTQCVWGSEKSKGDQYNTVPLVHRKYGSNAMIADIPYVLWSVESCGYPVCPMGSEVYGYPGFVDIKGQLFDISCLDSPAHCCLSMLIILLDAHYRYR